MIPWYIIKFYMQQHSFFASGIGLLLLCTVFFTSHFFLLLLLWTFVFGVVGTYCVISPDTKLPNFWFAARKKQTSQGDELALMKTTCPVCGQRRCPRHRPELNILAFQPWTNLQIPQKVDQAIEELLNIILKEFVYTWYRDLSTDEEFVDELKINLRFLASVLLRRAKKIDVPTLVLEKIAKAAMQHIDCFVQAREASASGAELEQAALGYLGSHVHSAMWSRRDELEYIRRLAEALFPYILRPQAQHSKATCSLIREILCGTVLLPAMDAIANPDFINNLLLIFFDDTPPPQALEPPSPQVTFLENFSQPQSHNNSCLRLTLSEILSPNNPQLLYPFMQFLKSEAAINVLQFCRDYEEFNKRILCPDVAVSEFGELQSTARELFKNYFAENALDRINFGQDIVAELQEIVEGPMDQIIRLRTSTPLFRAYEHAYNLLENNFLPLFHQSDHYYALICGGRTEEMLSRSSSRNNSKKKDSVFNLGSKLKEVFRTSSEDKLSSLDSTEPLADPSHSSGSSSYSLDEEDSGFGLEPQLHDLSSWRVEINKVGARPDPDNQRRKIFVYIVEVRRVDMCRESLDESKQSWLVYRRYAEFYILEQKLTEFHGEFPDCQLPPKKTFGHPKKQEFIESMREPFQHYLQTLLTKPNLKGSELLYNFLTREEEITSGFLQDIKIGKIMKAMPMKFVKEKGQHLESFLPTFEQSTEAPKPKPGKLVQRERRGSDVSQISTSSDKLLASMYENNANQPGQGKGLQTATPAMKQASLQSVFDYAIYVGLQVYQVPDWVGTLLMTGRLLLHGTVQAWLEQHLDRKLQEVTQEHRMVEFVHLLRNVLFFDTDPPRTEEQKRQRREETSKAFLDFVPKLFVWMIGQERQENGTKFLMEMLQHPKLNKQLSYVCLDIIILELFPELRGSN